MSLQKIKDRITELYRSGEEVLATSYLIDYRWYVDQHAFHVWRAASLSFLHRVFGENHSHSKLFAENCKFEVLEDTNRGLAILGAATQEIDGGHLKRIEALVSADVFTDFLDMAKHLIQQGYKDPAATLVGAVLQDGLRRIAQSKEILVRPGDDISALNQKLAQAGVYSRLTQRRVQVWNDLRNSAAHGRFDEYDADRVSGAIREITTFLNDHL